MLDAIRVMPSGVRVFMLYALTLLAGIGLSMRWVVDQAIDAPVSFIGIVWMCLLAFTIFTITMTLQRKQAARGLALGLSTLTLPGVPLAWLSLSGFPSQGPATAFLAALAGILFLGLTRPAAARYFNEP